MSRSASKLIKMFSDHKIDCMNALKMPKLIEIDLSRQSIVAQLRKIYRILNFTHIIVGKPQHYLNDFFSRNKLRLCSRSNKIYQMTPFAVDLDEFGTNCEFQSIIMCVVGSNLPQIDLDVAQMISNRKKRIALL